MIYGGAFNVPPYLKSRFYEVEDMKIYVNEMPNRPEACLFCKRKDGYMYCRISDSLCKLSRGGNCNKLKVFVIND